MTCRQYWCFLFSSMLTFLTGVTMVLISRLFTFFSSSKVNPTLCKLRQFLLKIGFRMRLKDTVFTVIKSVLDSTDSQILEE
jgi:hypothetical protein